MNIPINSKSTIFICGSARLNSFTRSEAEKFWAIDANNCVELSSKNINPYHYVNRPQDDFIPLIEHILKHDTIVILTPVYWYSMSGLMKNFFDRFTELITTYKSLGRAFAGKKMFLFVSGNNPEIPPGFVSVFESICDYMDMEFIGYHYVSTEQKND